MTKRLTKLDGGGSKGGGYDFKEIARTGHLRLQPLTEAQERDKKKGLLVDLRELDDKDGIRAILNAQGMEYKEQMKLQGEDELWETISRMHYPDLIRELFNDGIAPQLDGIEKLKHYIMYTTKFSDIDFDSFIEKKKREQIRLTVPILQKYLYHRRLCPTAHWIPTGAMEALMREMTDIPYGRRNIGIFGGNGCGKTTFWINLLLALLLPEVVNPWMRLWKIAMDKKSWAYCQGGGGKISGALMIPSTAIETVLYPALRKWSPYGSWESSARGKNRDLVIEFKDGGTLYIFTPNQAQVQLAGFSGDFWITTEIFEERKLGEMRQRLRGKGFMLHDIMPDYDAEGMKLSQTLAEMPENEKVVVNWHKDSACKECGIRGFKDHDQIEREKVDCPAHQRAARIYGIPLHSTGKVFTDFNDDVHIMKDLDVVQMVRDLGGTFGQGCDPHDGRPNLCLWWVALPGGVFICVDEWPRWNPEYRYINSPDWHVQALQDDMMPFHRIQKDWANDPMKFIWCIYQKEFDLINRYSGGIQKNGLPLYPKVNPCVLHRAMDPHPANQSSKIAGKDKKYINEINRIGAPYGIQYVGRMPKGGLKMRHTYLNGLLSGVELKDGERADEMISTTAPKLFVSDRCQNMIDSLRNAYYEPESIKGTPTGQLSNNPDRDLKHAIDASDYILRYPGFKYIPTEFIDKKLWIYKNLRADQMSMGGRPNIRKPISERQWRL